MATRQWNQTPLWTMRCWIRVCRGALRRALRSWIELVRLPVGTKAAVFPPRDLGRKKARMLVSA